MILTTTPSVGGRKMVTTLICILAILSCRSVSGPSMKVVTDGSQIVGRLVEETADSLVVESQDTWTVKKDGLKVETWKASEGKGIVYLKDFGKAEAYSGPDENTSIVGELCYEEGYVPETYPCIGYADGWFEIELDGAKAFVRESQVCWDAIDTF